MGKNKPLEPKEVKEFLKWDKERRTLKEIIYGNSESEEEITTIQF